MKKQRTETKTPCRELNVSELDHVRGGSVDVPVEPPKGPWPK